MILDIETTGLSPKYTQVILVGIIYHKDNEWFITQIFCDHRDEEIELLLILKDYIHKNHMLITYNGHAFDIPYLNKRYEHHNIDFTINIKKNFDLYRVIRSSKKALNLPNYKLKTIEEYLDIYRNDQISGKESVDLYIEYENRPTVQLRDKILLHNYDDILFMIPTLDILTPIPNHIIDRYYPFTFTYEEYSLILYHYDKQENYITMEYESDTIHPATMIYDDGFTLEVEKNRIKLVLPLFKIGQREFIDIDQIVFMNQAFNDLSVDQQLALEVTTKKDTLLASQEILRTHFK